MSFLEALVKKEQETSKTNQPRQLFERRNEFPHKYKKNTVGAYIRRELTHCSTWRQINEEIVTVKYEYTSMTRNSL